MTLPRRRPRRCRPRSSRIGRAQAGAVARSRHRRCAVLAGVGMIKDVQALRVGRHDAVLDSVVDHLDEVARAARSAMQVALLGRAALPSRPGVRCAAFDTRAPGPRRWDRAAVPRRRHRRSSGNNLAPCPRLRRWCPRQHSERPVRPAPWLTGCRHGSGVATVDDDVVASEQRSERLDRLDRRRRRVPSAKRRAVSLSRGLRATLP